MAAKAPAKVSHASLDVLANMTMLMTLLVIDEMKAERIVCSCCT
jgi:hypothetical protein